MVKTHHPFAPIATALAAQGLVDRRQQDKLCREVDAIMATCAHMTPDGNAFLVMDEPYAAMIVVFDGNTPRFLKGCPPWPHDLAAFGQGLVEGTLPAYQQPKEDMGLIFHASYRKKLVENGAGQAGLKLYRHLEETVRNHTHWRVSNPAKRDALLDKNIKALYALRPALERYAGKLIAGLHKSFFGTGIDECADLDLNLNAYNWALYERVPSPAIRERRIRFLRTFPLLQCMFYGRGPDADVRDVIDNGQSFAALYARKKGFAGARDVTALRMYDDSILKRGDQWNFYCDVLPVLPNIPRRYWPATPEAVRQSLVTVRAMDKYSRYLAMPMPHIIASMGGKVETLAAGDDAFTTEIEATLDYTQRIKNLLLPSYLFTVLKDKGLVSRRNQKLCEAFFLSQHFKMFAADTVTQLDRTQRNWHDQIVAFEDALVPFHHKGRRASMASTKIWDGLVRTPFAATNGITIMPLNSETALKAEGRMLEHCIGGYVTHCAEGGMHAFSLRDAERPDVALTTLTVHVLGNAIRPQVILHQNLGFKNRKADAREQQAVAEFVDAINTGKVRVDWALQKRIVSYRRTRHTLAFYEFDPRVEGNLARVYEAVRDGKWLPRRHACTDVWAWADKIGLKDYAAQVEAAKGTHPDHLHALQSTSNRYSIR